MPGEWWATLRQRRYPAGFRIAGGDSLSEEVARLAAALAPASQPAIEPPVPAVARPAAPPADLADLAVGACNQLYRLRRNLRRLEEGAADGRGVRGIRTALERLEEHLGEHGVVYRDLAGEPYEAGRLDFEPISAAEPRPEVDAPTIADCERPLVLVSGRMVQAARGLVVCPPEPDGGRALGR